MGMSASQARLIALTARMSDTEYEAQQINQQRLVLSNKMNEVYEALCNMEVPTPPSKIDFMKTQYKGKSGKNVYTAKINDDGKVTAYEKAEGNIVSKIGNQKVTAPAKPEQYINLASVVDSEALTKKNASDYRKVIDEKSRKETDRNNFAEGYREYVSGTIKEHYLEKHVTKQAFTDEENKYHEEEYEYVVNTKDVSINNMLISEYERKYKNSSEEVTATNSNKTVVTHQKYTGFEGVRTDHIYGEKYVSSSEDFDQNYTYKNGNEEITGAEAKKYNAQVEEKLKKNYAVKDGNTYKIVSGESLLNSGESGFEIISEKQLKDTLDAIKNGANGLYVGGNPTMSLKDAEAKFGPGGLNLESFNTAFEGLRNIYPDSYNDFTVIVSQNGENDYKFSFCMTEDLNHSLDTDGETAVWAPGQGEYDRELSDFKEEDITYDPLTGDICSFVVDGKPVKLSSEKVVDEFAYESAMNEYNNEKAEYDEEQNRLNKQTSIYQRQDKQLELKLTRLDNERNALNTEIEAVKKVIQDSIDRGYKTFSG